MPSPTAAEILERTRKLYATCRTLVAEGTSTRVTIRGAAPWNRETSREVFRHVVERTGCFLLDCREVGLGPEIEWHRRVAWKHAGKVHGWSTRPVGFPDPTDLESAVRWAWVQTCIVELALMFPGIFPGTRLPDLDTANLMQDDVDGTRCYRIDGWLNSHPIPVEIRAWLDSDGALVKMFERTECTAAAMRRFYEISLHHAENAKADPGKREIVRRLYQSKLEEKLEDFVVESTTTWRPRFDVDIDPATFEFTPPE